ncbi:hypothetical protein [Aquimarina longa]|uniref:hypothetical protein n=1 Tax=Aquimarina longa TaxID=1080221 RepID=UPI00078505D2|nr:hypothetical protein [Aquimarina longa]
MSKINKLDEITNETKRADLISYLIEKHTTGYQLTEVITKGAKFSEYLSNKRDGTTVIFKEVTNGGFDVFKSCSGITLKEIEEFLK